MNFNLSAWALKNGQIVRYFMLLLALVGAFSYTKLGQSEDPPFTFRAMVVNVRWPGATAEEVSKQVTERIEKKLMETGDFDRIISYSRPGESQVTFVARESMRSTDMENLWYQIRKKVNDIRHTLPQGVQGPFFNDEFGTTFGNIYALTGQGFDYAVLKDYADRVQLQLQRVKDVGKVELIGLQDEKIWVELSNTKLATLGVPLVAVQQALDKQNAVSAAGFFETPTDRVRLRVSGNFESVKEIRDFPIRVGDRTFRVGDVGEVHRGFNDPAAPRMRFMGEDALGIAVSMKSGGDILVLGDALEIEFARLQETLPAGMQLSKVSDQPAAVKVGVGEFVRVLAEALVIGLLVSFFSLGMRTGMVVALSIPLVLAMTFASMYYLGIGLHKISLGALVLALGLLVDDAIIAVEMMVLKLEEGYDKVRAATFAYELTAMPMLTGTLITAAGFLPIGIAKSVTGEYTFAIFAVTVIALVLSWIVSVYFVPYLGTLLLKVPPHVAAAQATHGITDDPHEVFDSPFYTAFRRLVHWCVEHRWLTIGATVLTFALGVVGMGKVQQQFFPDSSRPEIMVDIWFPEGTSFAGNEEVTKRVEQRLLSEPGVSTVSTWVGSGVPRFYLPLDQVFPQTNVSQFIVVPQDLKIRESLRNKLPALLAQEFPEVRGRIKLLPNGPPVPYPVQFRVVGPDPLVLRERADEVKAVLRQNPDMRGVNDNWNESVKVLRLEVDQAKARALGVTSQSIAQASKTILSGTQVGQFREGDKLIDIVLRQPLDERNAITDIANAYLPTASGKSIPLTQIAKPVFTWEPGVMWRENRDYAITVQGDVTEGLQGATVTAALLPALKEIEAQWRAAGQGGYRIEVAGAVEESSKGSASIAAGIPIMLFITFTLLMLQLHSFSRAMLVFLTGPLGLAGVAGALLLLGRPFGFVALLGVIALMGMIQRNSVILIDQIEQDRARGVPAWDAIVESAVRRLRPIVLTAAAAVLAMIPLSRSVFWGPMAVAIMGGLVVATVLTLLALPAMYAAWFRVRRPVPEVA